MTVIAPSSEPLDRAEADTGPARLAEFSAPFKKELSGVIDRLISEAAHELDAVLARAEAQSDSALRAAEAVLAEQRQRHDDLAESFAKGEKQIEGLQSQLQAVHEELETMRATTVKLQQQLEAETAERARLVATIRTVQQAFASVEPVTAVSDNQAPKDNVTPPDSRPNPDETSASTTSADRCLTLIASTPAPPPITAPRPLLDYLDQLFGQIDAIYEEDQQSRPLTEVVDRLTANLRCARDLFVKRATTVNGAALFDQQLSERLNGSTETPLIRHLAIAAHELAHSEESYRRAEAS